MPAAATDKFKKLSRRWVGQIGAGAVADGTTQTIPLASVTNLPTDTAVVAVIDRVDANGNSTPNLEETIIGVVSGSNLTNAVRGAEGTAQGHIAGAVVEVLVTAKGYNDIIDGILVGHNQDGTHILDTDGTLAANSDVKIASQKAVKTYVDGKGGTDGWNADSHTWTYSSVDGATGIVTINADLTGVIQAGDRIKFTQTTVKYFIVSKTPTFGAGVTTLTFYGGTDYTLANAAITLPSYSHVKAPFGFNTDPGKWTIRVTDSTDRSQASAAANTWYNLGTTASQITLPIGIWDVYYNVNVEQNSAAVVGVFATLSTANNTESDTEMTVNINTNGAFQGAALTKRKTITESSKTTLYLNTMTTVGSTPTIYNRNSVGNGSPMIIEAKCAYL